MTLVQPVYKAQKGIKEIKVTQALLEQQVHEAFQELMEKMENKVHEAFQELMELMELMEHKVHQV